MSEFYVCEIEREREEEGCCVMAHEGRKTMCVGVWVWVCVFACVLGCVCVCVYQLCKHVLVCMKKMRAREKEG